ncbi:MAG: D-glucuronyl C5-epimerase family protein, partial [Candidatus Zixiibacteriota bacterium]
KLIAAYHYERDTAYLDQAEKYARCLVREAMVFDDALYYPYRFDYRVHKREDAFLAAPWFSGMAQGEALGVMTRLFDETGDSAYLDYANRTFKSMLRVKDEAEPWTSLVDERGCYWIEEYPTTPPSLTLNGFIAAVFGVYDYYETTRNDAAARVLEDCFSTVKNYIPLFRRKGKVSFYDLTFRHYDAVYHQYHINQLRHLENMSGDSFFGDWADSLKADYDEDKK